MKEFFKKKPVQITLLVCGVIAVVYAMIYVDVVSRAKESFLEGEKYWRWHEHPEEKKTYLEKELQNRLAELEKDFKKNKFTQEQYEDRIDIAKFDYERNMEESSIKYAYVWYQTVVELFTPPESKWVKKAREKMVLAKEKWKEELRSKNIPFEDYMLE